MEERELSFRTDGARMLPVWAMAGTEFFLDLRMDEFRQRNDHRNRIFLDDIHEEDGWLILLFDKNTKNVVQEPIDWLKLPSHVELVTIPPLADLDPVGVAQKYSSDPGMLLDENGRGKSLEELNRHAFQFREEFIASHGIRWIKDKNSPQSKAAIRILEAAQTLKNEPPKHKRI